MRALWLALCLALIAGNCVQADPYRKRDRDDGFNPLGVMRDMPSPMKMFDSSDKRRSDRRRPPPPPPPYYRAPLPGYPGPAYPPAGPAPYGYYSQQPSQSRQSRTPQAVVPAPAQAPQMPASSPQIESRQPVMTAPAGPATQSTAPNVEQPVQGYSFRPMTPMQPETGDMGSPPQATHTSPGYPNIDRTPAPPPVTATQENASEPVMINGKPAVFRPLHLGDDNQAE